jgi:hypothetical protein
VLVDTWKFPGSLSSDLLSLGFPIIYFWYFSRSDRVRWVFAPTYSGQRSVQVASASE